MTAKPTTEKPLAAFQTPQGTTVPWLSLLPFPVRGQSQASGHSIEFMSMPVHQRDAETDLVGVLEQVAEMTLGRPVLQDKASQDYSLRTPLQESRLMFTGGIAESHVPPPPPPPLLLAISSSAADSLTPSLRQKRRSSHQCTPVGSELDLTSPQNQRVALIGPKRYRSNSSIVRKMHTCPLLPTSPDLSEAGEIRHEPCFSPVYQSSTAHIPTPSVPMEPPLASITSASTAKAPPPPPPPMPLFGSPSIDARKVSASGIHPLKMRKADSIYAFPH
jgi:hypothetical protein